jgi:hypothetical protein
MSEKKNKVDIVTAQIEKNKKTKYIEKESKL